MSYTTNPSPPPFMPPYPGAGGGDICGFWPQSPMNTENPDSSFVDTHPYKRQRSCGNNYNMQDQNNRPMQPLIQTNMGAGACHIFYKTRLCQKFFEGNCRNSDRCTFAHGHADLRNPPPNWQEIVGSKDKDNKVAAGNWDDDQRIIQKMKICRKFYNGEECPYGNKCNFLHECPSKFKSDVIVTINREIEDNSAALMPIPADLNNSDQTDTFNNNNNNFHVKSTYWKTRLCSKWETTGFCPFGDRCHFAHGFLEIQQPGNVGGDAIGRGMINNVSVDDVQVQPHVLLPSNSIISTTPLMTADVRRSKWKTGKKINRIYGDWLDSANSPPKGIPGRAVEEES
ncbi:zinc finger CCCH domain-containing protein 39-like [Impatiens glandulifera]|uniref:zinc finger CCCH domain-containing protein 39-like n=1 Tax=Impatiens glandulifera TaxID=253017 RepID=UPI001FB19C44|nr:zinc finger CCCH domain-containing protein 39-like [Impatiens glandulifera]